MMPNNLNEKEIEFIKTIKKSYHGRSFIKNITNYKYFSEKIKPKGAFTQITNGILMNSSDFFDHIDNSLIAGDIGVSIAYGEIMYLIKRLKEKLRFKIEKKDVLNCDILIDELNKLPIDFKPKSILIPIDEDYYMKFYKEFGDQGKLKFEKGSVKLQINNQELDIYWSNRYMPFKEIYLLGEDAVNWTIKTTDQMQPPKIEKLSFVSSVHDTDKEIDTFYGFESQDKIYFGARVVVFANLNVKSVRCYKPTSEKTRDEKEKI